VGDMMKKGEVLLGKYNQQPLGNRGGKEAEIKGQEAMSSGRGGNPLNDFGFVGGGKKTHTLKKTWREGQGSE